MMSSEHSAAKVGEIFNKAGAAFTHLGELCLQVYTATEDFWDYERSQTEGTSKETSSNELSASLKNSALLSGTLECPQGTSFDDQLAASNSDIGAVLANTSHTDGDVVGLASR